MNPPEEPPKPTSNPTPKLWRVEEARRIVAEYANDLREIIAKLRRKMPKFALMVAHEEPRPAEVHTDVVTATFEILRQLGHSESDARRLLDTALQQKKKFKDEQELLQAIYTQSRT